MERKTKKGKYIFCQAENFQQLFLVDKEGKIKSMDIPQVLSTIKCDERTETKKLLKYHNKLL